MTLYSFIELLNFVLVFIFGLILSTRLSGGCETKKQWIILLSTIPFFLLLQGIFFISFGETFVRQIYPLIVHVPIFLLLVFYLRKSAGLSLVSICMAYLCCQFPRWSKLLIVAWTESELLSEICYSIVLIATFIILYRYFCDAAYEAMIYSSKTLILFGSLPIVYYIFDYATTIYSKVLYSNITAMIEFLPTLLIVFYVIFLTAYHMQLEKSSQAKLLNSMLEIERKQKQSEINLLRKAETQIAIHQHDMRHHLVILDGLISSGKTEQASEYIRKTANDIASITPERFCENDIVNLICSFFSDKGKQDDIELIVDARIPATPSISDTELCAILSNSLENAFNAVAALEKQYRKVKFNCQLKQEKLLIEIQNPFDGKIIIKNGIPHSEKQRHGYGCQSIRSITENYHGICTFETANNIFTLRIVLPIKP